MSMTEARTKLGASDNLFKKVYQGLKARDVIEYIKNDLNIHKKIITVRDPQTKTGPRSDKKSVIVNLETRLLTWKHHYYLGNTIINLKTPL